MTDAEKIAALVDTLTVAQAFLAVESEEHRIRGEASKAKPVGRFIQDIDAILKMVKE